MRARSTRALAALIAVFALSAVGVAQASAHEFIASVAGTLESKQSSVQDFSNEWWEFGCEKATGTATVIKGSQKTIKETVQYGNCLLVPLTNMKVSPAEWEFSAEGTVTLLKIFTFENPKTFLQHQCTMRFGPTTGFSNKVVYQNLAGGKLSTQYDTRDLNSKNSGEPCGQEGVTGAVAKGMLESTLASGTLTWK